MAGCGNLGRLVASTGALPYLPRNEMQHDFPWLSAFCSVRPYYSDTTSLVLYFFVSAYPYTVNRRDLVKTGADHVLSD